VLQVNKVEQVYQELRKHLDHQAVGLPATKSGAEIRILKRIFTPEEARLAVHLSYHPQSSTQIYEIIRSSGMSKVDMENMLDSMVQKGGIMYVEKNNVRHYYNMPFVVGILEQQLGRLTPDFLADLEEYQKNRAFGITMLTTKVPQMRTIPVGKSIQVQHHVTTYDNVKELINATEGPIAVQACLCRKISEIHGKKCKQTSRLETCMGFGEWAKEGIRAGVSRGISKDEALEIIKQNEADGLVLQPSNDQKVEFVCSCCGCCCGMLVALKMLPKVTDYWATNYYAAVNTEICTSCGTCVERCPMNAAKINEKGRSSTINLDHCIGCGNCVATCPSGALSLVKREKETIPPIDVENLLRINAENKPGTLDKVKLMAHIVLKK
jgi:Na+-translocating ferredoxin:NAD+ oxidoreductase subunit B